MKRAVLGRGLSALIPTERPPLEQVNQAYPSTPTPMEESLQTSLVSQLAQNLETKEESPKEYLTNLPIDSLVPNPYQPRTKFNEGS